MMRRQHPPAGRRHPPQQMMMMHAKASKPASFEGAREDAIKVERPRGGCQPICEVLYGIGIAACVECVVSRSRGERP